MIPYQIFTTMSRQATIHARIDAEDKKRAEKIFAELALTQSFVVNLLYKQIGLRGGLPFPVEIPKKPNHETLRAIKDALSGEGKSFADPEELFGEWLKL